MSAPQLPPLPKKKRFDGVDMHTYGLDSVELNARPAGLDSTTLEMVIRRLNANPYNLTKAECIQEVKALMEKPNLIGETP